QRNEINQNLVGNLKNVNNNDTEPCHDNTNFTMSSYPLPSIWRPSQKLIELFNEFQYKILYDYPHVPCCYCSILMFRSKAQWVNYDQSEEYTLKIAFPDISVYTYMNNRGQVKVSICGSC